ncbi:hypothetical protein BAUCODRAFT_77565 [Baudoinia panamericana UAMH 10762]|uniref:Cyclin-like domain-containing protein n=1 Tax=Baudoinia panamericana (strain UAMH 10762) TaxID=717646 RepID=M2N1R9_BAUPA|nr:uncharacterized protein BAUCODRAFT_77565 [Baudoinia panamericana UAMH 10762]EMC92590.1 hypothetical protein BAUCODRAFT_77565 [Baudoinia panamericana UAMH 10762]
MAAPAAAPRRRLATLTQPAGRLSKFKPQQKQPQAKCCDDPDIKDEDGMKICLSCGTQLADVNIVADVTFEEDARGAATVQGGFIGENARHARTFGPKAFRRIGGVGGERNSTQEAENKARRTLASICPRLNITDDYSIQAQRLFGLAARLNFTSGRSTDEVVGACLFAACRKNPQNSVLLMDIADIFHINVFRLGEVYKNLCKDLCYHKENLPIQQLVDVEPLIQKYCRKLEFGTRTRDVAEDAVKILKRMNRDWMVTGRHPAGICGACIILAARMNNFRRSVREVVYVAKVADMTIAKRIEEFRRTKASTLSVDQFRESGWRMKSQHDPPALMYSQLNKEKFEEKKRKRQENNEARATAERESMARGTVDRQIPNQEPITGGEDDRRRKRQRTSGPQPTSPPTQQQPRYDSDGFAIPALPRNIDPALTGETPQTNGEEPPKKRRGRPKKQPTPAVSLSEEEMLTEQEIEKAIEQIIDDDDFQAALEAAEKEKSQEEIDAAGLPASPSEAEPPADVEDDLSMLDNDPEIMMCKLSDEEQAIKESIWVAHNEDWLRAQHEKELLQRLAKETAADKAKQKRAAGKGGKQRKKHSRIGDRSVLEDAETPIETPADAARAMLEKRADKNFSKYVDYDSLKRVYNLNNSPASASSRSRASSEVPSSSGRERAGSVASSVRLGAERESATPVPQARTVSFGLQSPQPTQQAVGRGAAVGSPAVADKGGQPLSPPPTQDQTGAGDDEAVEEEQDEVEDDDREFDMRSEQELDEEYAGWDNENAFADENLDVEGDEQEYQEALRRYEAEAYEENEYQ